MAQVFDNTRNLREKNIFSMKKAITIALAMIAMASCSDYRGTRITFGTGDVYFTPNVTEAETQKFGKFLLEELHFFEGTPVTFQLDKTNGEYQVRMVSIPNAENRIEMVNGAKTLTWALSEEVFNNQPVNFHFCDERKMKVRRSVMFERIGTKQVVGSTVFYSNLDKVSFRELSAAIQSDSILAESTYRLTGNPDGKVSVYMLERSFMDRKDVLKKQAGEGLAKWKLSSPISWYFTDEVFVPLDSL